METEKKGRQNDSGIKNKGRQKDSGNTEQGRQWKHRTREGRKATEDMDRKEEQQPCSCDSKAGGDSISLCLDTPWQCLFIHMAFSLPVTLQDDQLGCKRDGSVCYSLG